MTNNRSYYLAWLDTLIDHIDGQSERDQHESHAAIIDALNRVEHLIHMGTCCKALANQSKEECP